MHPHFIGFKVALINTAAAVVPAAAVIQVSETAVQAQITNTELVKLSLALGLVSSVFALAWNGFQIIRSIVRWWRERNAREGE